ncbi:Bifunctional protein RIB2,Uncharacterized protein C18B11.02c,RNA pseudouridylate synthase domain-containing protein 2 [Lepeophtheirus salmonis]|uniref:Bifunctional protein RIB2,Uncharacterized protein C18B11.02c,RNA pseudouridylate synthase domain-containing protein 2 n=1 Tax=Lepeophtheirus salmonis TaxID=72036 RepID=A0A7R8CPN9_LEPSM|nr:Bifunctional protein RIB2,Uncharacterized protein C18B11.02c,RNA pseudouridylate synthase domain-containing protein 2 [Lepeophtheirus salmonis]CAF2888208.1 Bifunctional protein RIB2,Uncharacterized protein C18B11.02c,RNA pseudouridylate synthase domain-containing protein 2 [Lepeophtheirus salmonis]
MSAPWYVPWGLLQQPGPLQLYTGDYLTLGGGNGGAGSGGNSSSLFSQAALAPGCYPLNLPFMNAAAVAAAAAAVVSSSNSVVTAPSPNQSCGAGSLRRTPIGTKDLRSSNPHNFIPSSNAPSSSVSSTSPSSKRKLEDIPNDLSKSDVKKAKLETKALKAKRPGFTDERYNETTYYHDSDTKLRKFRAHPAEEYERYTDYRLKHNDLLANIVHRHEVPVSSERINIIHMDDELVVVNKPASIPVHPCGRYRHNTIVLLPDFFSLDVILKKAREMEQQIRTRQCRKEYVCRVEGEFPKESIICKESIEVISYKIGVCKVSPSGKDCHTEFQRLSYNGQTSVVLCKPHTGRMHQIRVHLQFLGYPVINDPLYNHAVFGPLKGKGGNIGKTDDEAHSRSDIHS